MTRDQISAAIAERAWRDEAFHAAVLADGNAAYEAETGRAPPPGVTIKVLEDTPNTVHFVIPAKPVNAGELSDAELENVAGGITPSAGMLIVTASLMATTAALSGLGGGVTVAVSFTKAGGGRW